MMSERELDTNQQEHALAGKTVSPENEQMVYYTVIQLIDWMLERYPTTAEVCFSLLVPIRLAELETARRRNADHAAGWDCTPCSHFPTKREELFERNAKSF
jgi:hypothetical protein